MSLVAQEIPKVGLVMETVKVVRWLKSVGDTLTPGEPLVEVESEKSVVELEATVAGRLVEILVQVDEEASVGDRIAWVESASAQPASPTAPSNTPVAEVPVVAQPAAAPAPSAPGPAGTGDRVAISPVARKLAAENGIPLAELTGSGPRGRIELDDVKRAISTKSSNPPPSKDESGTLTPMRRAMARAVEAILYRDIRGIGGSFSAEHGVGSKRIASLLATSDPGKLDLMARVKALLDPKGLMNPGKVLAGGTL